MSASSGYTLAEALAAILILGLATAGMTAGVQTFGRHQARAADGVARARNAALAQAAVADILVDAGPFLSDGAGGLKGDAHGFQFPCGGGVCEVRSDRANGPSLAVQRRSSTVLIAPPSGRSLQFSYIAGAASSDRWPPAQRAENGPIEPLVQIALIEDPGARTLGVWRIWREQASDCVFDSIGRTCRTRDAAGAGS